MSADIEVRNVFTMKGRGAVVIGYLRRGSARIGQQTRVPAPGAGPQRVLTIAAVETVHSHDSSEGALGFVFRERPTIEEIGPALTPGTLLQFEDAAVA
jgi:translation elongation factor EF-Tu-like GTPase